jgi:hypothetical protein
VSHPRAAGPCGDRPASAAAAPAFFSAVRPPSSKCCDQHPPIGDGRRPLHLTTFTSGWRVSTPPWVNYRWRKGRPRLRCLQTVDAFLEQRTDGDGDPWSCTSRRWLSHPVRPGIPRVLLSSREPCCRPRPECALSTRTGSSVPRGDRGRAVGVQWVLAQGTLGSRVVLAGDSAGGGLTVAALVALRDRGVAFPEEGCVFCPGSISPTRRQPTGLEQRWTRCSHSRLREAAGLYRQGKETRGIQWRASLRRSLGLAAAADPRRRCRGLAR